MMKRMLAGVFLAAMVACGDVAHIDEGAQATRPLVIAHRGSSGYLPEHTIAAKALAYGQGADYIEQDLVMTKDDHLVVLHDHHLDTVTDVAAVYPERSRADGRYYVIDFTLAEIRQLAVSERFRMVDGKSLPVYEDRFPLGQSSFRVHTFSEEIELIQGLNKATGQSVGIYPEIKSPAFHHEAGKDIAAATLDVLLRYGYRSREDSVFLQCFDWPELQRIKSQLLPERDMSIKLVQLINTSETYSSLLSETGLERLAEVADGLGPPMSMLLLPEASPPASSGLVEAVHALGLLVHPYTFRREVREIPPGIDSFDELHRVFFEDIGIDGVFTDFPDVTADYLEARQ